MTLDHVFFSDVDHLTGRALSVPLQDEISSIKDSVKKEEEEKQALLDRVDVLQSKFDELEEQKREAAMRLARVENEPTVAKFCALLSSVFSCAEPCCICSPPTRAPFLAPPPPFNSPNKNLDIHDDEGCHVWHLWCLCVFNCARIL